MGTSRSFSVWRSKTSLALSPQKRWWQGDDLLCNGCEYHQTHFVFQRVTRCTSYQSQCHISCIPFPL
uniref:Uncharacterized protein n=1 Tax=Anguilla anguilla TaxID=7936 RepID=A0A0E9XZ88_ANGAN